MQVHSQGWILGFSRAQRSLSPRHCTARPYLLLEHSSQRDMFTHLDLLCDHTPSWRSRRHQSWSPTIDLLVA